MYPEIFVLISQWEVCQEGGSKRGYLEDIEWSWLETWMKESFLTSRRIFFYPNEGTLKFLCWYPNSKCVRKGGSRRGDLGGRCGFLKMETWMSWSFLMSWMMFFRKIPWKFNTAPSLLNSLSICSWNYSVLFCMTALWPYRSLAILVQVSLVLSARKFHA